MHHFCNEHVFISDIKFIFIFFLGGGAECLKWQRGSGTTVLISRKKKNPEKNETFVV